jgi:acyl carrier protein
MERNVIDVQTFIRNIQRHLDCPIPRGLESRTRFRDLPGWNSLQALIIVASFEWDYGVTISSDEFLRADTIQELHGVVLCKLGV